MRDGELQERSKVSGGEEDRATEVRDVQPAAVPGTGGGTGVHRRQTPEAAGRVGRTGVRQQSQDVPLVVSHVHGRVRRRRGDRDQIVGPVRTRLRATRPHR